MLEYADRFHRADGFPFESLINRLDADRHISVLQSYLKDGAVIVGHLHYLVSVPDVGGHRLFLSGPFPLVPLYFIFLKSSLKEV